MTGGPGPGPGVPRPGPEPAGPGAPRLRPEPAGPGGRVPVLVCGEPLRGDDAAGPAAVELLAADVRARAEVTAVGQLDLLVLLDLPADAPCVVVDAVAGLPAGEIWVRPLEAVVDRARDLAGSGRVPEPRSSHELPVDQVLALAATLRERPPAGTFVGIGGERWDLGAALSPAVATALPAFAAAIAAAIEHLAAGVPGAPGAAGAAGAAAESPSAGRLGADSSSAGPTTEA